MPQRHRIVYAPIAVDDMDEAFSYIAKDNISAAEALLKRIDEGVTKLADFPAMGSVLSEEEYTLVAQGYRFVVIHPYLLFYRIVKDTVVIHRTLHGRRDYLRELF